MELRGVSCLALEEVAPPRQEIIVSRSFGEVVTELDGLHSAIATFTSLAAEKLRRQGSAARGV